MTLDNFALLLDSVYSILSSQNFGQHIIAKQPLPPLLGNDWSLAEPLHLLVINHDPELSANTCMQFMDKLEDSSTQLILHSR